MTALYLTNNFENPDWDLRRNFHNYSSDKLYYKGVLVAECDLHEGIRIIPDDPKAIEFVTLHIKRSMDKQKKDADKWMKAARIEQENLAAAKINKANDILRKETT